MMGVLGMGSPNAKWDLRKSHFRPAVTGPSHARLTRGRTIRFSHSLEPQYFEQLASERKIVRMTRGRPQIRFERKAGMRAEALDALVYSLAAKAALSLNAAAFAMRADE